MLQGKIALVAGPTSGVGLGIACSLAVQGVDIIINGSDDVEVPKVQIAVAGKNVIHIGCHGADMSKPAEIEAMFAYVDAEFGSVDVLVNNAGIQYAANVEDFPTECWDVIIATSLASAFHAARLAMPGMKYRNWGRIINVASAYGLVASAQKSAYMATKHGIVGFTRSVALGTVQTGITFNAICPGWALTLLVQKQIDAHAEKDGLSAFEAKTDLLMEKQPSHEFVASDQLSTLAVFLCNDAAEQVRDVAWNIDGSRVTQ